MIKKLDSIFARKVIEVYYESRSSNLLEAKKGMREMDIEKVIRGLFCSGEIYGYFYGDKIIGALGIKELNKNSIRIIFVIILPNFRARRIEKKFLEFVKKISKKRGYEKILHPEYFSLEDKTCLFFNRGFKEGICK